MKPYTVVLIIPTGIGAEIGGYAGDALPVARVLASACDRLITHPNVLNGAQLYWPLPNAYYVEGYGLDRFSRGDWYLEPVRSNRVGLLFDRAVEPELLQRHLQVADATRATLGLSLTDYVVTDEPLGVELRRATSGASWGTVANPDSLLRGAEVLIKKAKAEAIAIVARFPDDIDSAALMDYRHGKGVDPLAGAEAVLSHLVVSRFRVPAAHAPALAPLPLDFNLSPRSAAEEIGYTFLPCVLVGLSRAPRFSVSPSENSIAAADVDAVIVPASACGSSTVLSLCQGKASIIAVTENRTRMKVEPEALGIRALRVNSYMEAIGAIVAGRTGVDIESLRPNIAPLNSFRELE